MKLLRKLEEKVINTRAYLKDLVKEQGDQVIGQVKVKHLLNGNRGIDLLISDLSYVDPQKGLNFHGLTVGETIKKLPKPDKSHYPYAGGMYYFLLTGELPTLADALSVETAWKQKSTLPAYVVEMIKAMPEDTHPMTMFSQAILALQTQSEFAAGYSDGLKKPDYWKATFSDSINLIGKTPALAAAIYNIKFGNGAIRAFNPELDWSANFAHLIYREWDYQYRDLCRLFFIIHADQGTGNVSAHTACLVNSALSDVYYSCSAAMNGLAGPLHGRANQDCLTWLLEIIQRFGDLPSKEQLEGYVWETLNKGKVIPGYGHAVLRCTDPRFEEQLKFGVENFKDDILIRLAEMVYEIVPPILTEHGKAKSPWPNVDAISGSLQYHCGLKEFEFYPVLFGVGRLLGITANLIWNRAMNLSLERPQSITFNILNSKLDGKVKTKDLKMKTKA